MKAGCVFRRFDRQTLIFYGSAVPKEPTVLYNAMIHPFVYMTMYGAIWYQGKIFQKKYQYKAKGRILTVIG